MFKMIASLFNSDSCINDLLYSTIWKKIIKLTATTWLYHCGPSFRYKSLVTVIYELLNFV